MNTNHILCCRFLQDTKYGFLLYFHMICLCNLYMFYDYFEIFNDFSQSISPEHSCHGALRAFQA